ncbi:MAG: T9SS type A sorting domain-containing protein [Ignavibacteriaceae bacterium]
MKEQSMRLLKLPSTVLMFQLLVSSISYSQIWEKTSDRPTNVTDFKIFSFVENGQKVQYVLSTTGEGLFKSTDNGAFWTNVGLTGIELTGMIQWGGVGVYLVSAEDGIHHFDDIVGTWTISNNGIENLFITDIASHVLLDIYIGTSGHGVYKSDDGGFSWLPFNNGMEDQTVLDIETDYYSNASTENLVVTTIGGGVWRYNEIGQIWEQINQGNSTLYNPAIAGDSDGNLYMYSGDNILSANLLNFQWGIEYYHPAGRDIEIANDDKVFAASLGFGVARKDIFGVWADYSDGLPEDNAGFIDVIDIDIDSDGFVWAAVTPLDPTVIGGIFKTIEPVTDVQEISLGIPEAYILEQNYPNPFNPTTIIEYSIPEQSYVELKVYDVLGNEVATLVNQEQSSGTYRADFIAHNLSSGFYVAHLRAGNISKTIKMSLLK